MRAGVKWWLGAMAAMVAATGALAEEPAALEGLKACWNATDSVEVSFSVMGSPCWEVLAPAVTGGYGPDVGRVVFPTRATAEVCAQMLQAIPVAASIPADPLFTALSVVVTGPDGGYVGIGEAPIAGACTKG